VRDLRLLTGLDAARVDRGVIEPLGVILEVDSSKSRRRNIKKVSLRKGPSIKDLCSPGSPGSPW